MTTGNDMHEWMRRLFPICRSITGEGVRETLRNIQEQIPLAIHHVPSGAAAFDWTVPREWVIRDAYVKNSKGEKVIDFQRNNLHVLNYSAPVRRTMPFAELKEHLHTLPDYPDWVPYLTSYYKEEWGLCLSHRRYEALEDGDYDVCIDSELKDGHLTYGEFYQRGATPDEILLSCYICHPSMCNDNLSGIVLGTFLAKYLQGRKDLKYSYRIIFIPETIGAVVWLSRNEDKLAMIKHGLVMTCVGDGGAMTYKRTRRGNCEIDDAAQIMLRDSGDPYEVHDFDPASGSDERQFCSPGFNLPIGSLVRTPYGRYPEYHTSADDCDLVRPEFLEDSFKKYTELLWILEQNAVYQGANPKCEPQLGKRGLFRALGGQKTQHDHERALWWVLNFSDGSHSLLDIARRSGIRFVTIREVATILLAHNLID